MTPHSSPVIVGSTCTFLRTFLCAVGIGVTGLFFLSIIKKSKARENQYRLINEM